MKFVGLRNFINLFNSDRVFWIAFKNTIVYAIAANIGQNGLALIFSILLVKQNSINNFFKTVYYLPAILSSVAVGFTWGFILDPTIGIVNTALNGMGLGSLALSWLGDHRTVILSIAFIHIWQAVGGATILFIAGLLDISNDYYEAANIEGANRWQTFIHITFPLLMPVTIINIVLTTIGCFKSFDYVYILTGGGGDNSSHVLATWLFKQGFQYNAVGYASAISVILSITVSLIALGQLNMQREDKKERGFKNEKKI
jgi:ABC-type sugar transport systems, permease components